MKINKKRNKQIIKFNLLLGSISIIVGLLLNFNIKFPHFFEERELNLNLKEIDTYYENNNSIEYISYIDTTWAWPTDNNYYISNSYSHYHPAIDIVTNANLNIYASYQGEVITNSYKYDNGNYLVIKQNNGYYVMYAHLSQKLVNVGDKIQKGQLIGIMGRTGYATGTHLHFSVWDGYPHHSNSINPLSFY